MSNSFCQVNINGTTYQVEPGTLASSLLFAQGCNIDMPCGGAGTCGKCRVIAEGAVSAPLPAELRFLNEQDLKEHIRLACHMKIIGDCRITLLENKDMAQIAVDGMSQIEIADPMYSCYGLAIDIGTTTIAMKLFDKKGCLVTLSARNEQIIYGADVISRIDKSMRGAAKEIQQSTAANLNQMIEKMAKEVNIEQQAIDALVITGNTAMLYLLTASDPDCLSHTPFIADRLFGEYVSPQELGLELSTDCQVYLTRCIGAYVGGDISSAILASNLTASEQTALLVDIGTNGEMALWHNQQLVCCSTAAGPAFEGAEIALGMQAAKGAVDKVWLQEGKIHFSTIGNAPAEGICGSGVIDAVSTLKDAKLIDENGGFEKQTMQEMGLLIEINGKPACRFADNIYITQRDVRMVQLAKSAICAGIRTMLQEIEIEPAAICHLYLAGGFGNYLNIASAANIGLIPGELVKRTSVIGNAALQGAAETLTNRNRSEKELVERLNAEPLELGANKHFMDFYISCMEF